MKDNGDALVPSSYETFNGYKLGRWVTKQRSRQNDLTVDRRDRLEAIQGWIWSRHEYQWEEGFKHLQQYVIDNGDALVPHAYQNALSHSSASWDTEHNELRARAPGP